MIRTGRSGWARWTAVCSSNASPSCSARGNSDVRAAAVLPVSAVSQSERAAAVRRQRSVVHVRSVVSRQPFRRYRSHRRRQPADGRGDDAVAECRHRHGAVPRQSRPDLLLRGSARDVERRHHGRRSSQDLGVRRRRSAPRSAPHWCSRTSATWDPNDGQLNEIGSTLQYRRDNRHIFNLGYRRRDDIQPLLKQSDIVVLLVDLPPVEPDRPLQLRPRGASNYRGARGS